MRLGWFFILWLSVVVSGCGPSAKERARQDFQEEIAAMKVCTRGSTYEEFREKRLALETCCAAHPSLASPAFNDLSETMTATDTLWYFSIHHPSRRIEDDSQAATAVARLLNKAINATLKGSPVPTIPDGMDMRASDYVRLGLTLISIK